MQRALHRGWPLQHEDVHGALEERLHRAHREDLPVASRDAGGLVAAAAVYVDARGAAASGRAARKATAARDKVLKDDAKALGGLNAVSFKRLPIRPGDAGPDAKMPHPGSGALEAAQSEDSLPVFVGYPNVSA